MPTAVEEILYTKEFESTLRILMQQMESRLRGAVMVKNGCRGEETFLDYTGPIELQEAVGRYQDTPFITPDFQRRRVTPTPYEGAIPFDKFDGLKGLADPRNAHVRNLASAANRRIDQNIITAATGTAYTGKDGSTSVALPADMKVAVNLSGSTEGLTVGKVLRAKRILDEKENVRGEPRFFVCSASEVENMLNLEKATSSDYVGPLNRLNDGEIDHFGGFSFIRTELLSINATTDITTCFAFRESAIGLCFWQDVETRISELPSKSYAWQAYVKLMFGASRVDEDGVVEVPCDRNP